MLNTISEFFADYGDILLTGTRDTLVMVLVSTLFAYLLGLPLGVALTVTSAPTKPLTRSWVGSSTLAGPFPSSS